MGRTIKYLSVLSLSITCLWLSGMMGANVLLTAIQPIVYGNRSAWSVSKCFERLHESMFGVIAPFSTIEKNKIAVAYPTDSELYPTEFAFSVLNKENEESSDQTSQVQGDEGEDSDTSIQTSAPVANEQGVVYTAEMLRDVNHFMNTFYLVDSSTYADGLLDAELFMDMDLSIHLSGEEPKVLIYHTHSQEGFSDSRAGVWQDTVVGLGDRLKSELEERYNISTLHVTDTFDVIDGVTDRSAAYTYAEERIWQILEDYPSIQVIIDLHRDGVNENTRLVTNVNGKETAQLMLLNGLCRTKTSGPISYLQNEYLTENLAFSFQVQSKAAAYYPTLMRKIYLRSYQYNLHILPRCLLVECGAQTNTVEEAQNAMPLLADLLYLVLSGS